jgi:hypothetical protein
MNLKAALPSSDASLPAEPVQIVAGVDENRQPLFAVLVKRTFAIRSGQPLLRLPGETAFRLIDEYYDHGDPEVCSVKYENDLAPYKLATDVVVVGKAYAPNGTPVAQMSIGVEVDGRRKLLRVFGDRQCRFRENDAPAFTEPIPFTDMEIRYERAYGGKDETSDPERPFYYPRNHLGIGIVLKNLRESVDGLVLPNVEDPQDLLTPERVVLGERDQWNRQPLPQGLGWFQKTWYPRCSFVGAVPGDADPDEVMREEALGLVPRRQMALARQFKLPSFDVRFNNGGSLGLVVPYLKPGALVRLARMTLDGTLSFTLPKDWPRMTLDIGTGENDLRVVLHTLCVRVEDAKVDLVWRGALPYPGPRWLPKMKRLHAEVH